LIFYENREGVEEEYEDCVFTDIVIENCAEVKIKLNNCRVVSALIFENVRDFELEANESTLTLEIENSTGKLKLKRATLNSLRIENTILSFEGENFSQGSFDVENSNVNLNLRDFRITGDVGMENSKIEGKAKDGLIIGTVFHEKCEFEISAENTIVAIVERKKEGELSKNIVH
jgi:hypothetical protein